MTISLNNLGKRYNREWIFRNLTYTFAAGNSYAITGSNGSGKSTLLQVIAGAVTHSEGTIQYAISNAQCSAEEQFQHISIATPYMELIEEMTANEFLSFHTSFKKLAKTSKEILEAVNLTNAADKQIRYYSSGMKQRLKLAQAFFSNTDVLLLDEPIINLDEEGIALYHQLINNCTTNKLVIVSSNDKQEYGFCNAIVEIGKYKQE